MQRVLRRHGRKNAKKIQEYIQNELKNDLEYDQLTLNEYIDPFTGEPVKKAKSKSQEDAQEAEGTGIGHYRGRANHRLSGGPD